MTQGPPCRGWKTIVVCASGPSFTPDQQALVVEARARNLCRVVVVNNQWEHVPNADVLYASDGGWFDHYLPAVRAHRFAGELWTQDEKAAAKHGLHHVIALRGDSLPATRDCITQGSNSGHAAIQLAARFGATRIVLCGFDLCRPNGVRHNHADHALPLSNGNPVSWQPRFPPLADSLSAAGVEVLNCSPLTALDCFPRAALESALGLVTA